MDNFVSFEEIALAAEAAGCPYAAEDVEPLYRKVAADPALRALTVQFCDELESGRVDPRVPNDMDEPGRRLFRIMAVLMCYRTAMRNYAKIGCSDLAGTAWRDIEHWTSYFKEETGSAGIAENVASWMTNHIRGELFQLGRLQYQLPATLDEDEDGRPAIQPGDPVVLVHIYGGEPILPEDCVKSLREFRRFHAERFPDYKFVALATFTWLLDKAVLQMLPENSNIRRFASLFDLRQTDIPSDALHRLFKEQAPTMENARTSLQKKALEFVEFGGRFMYGLGIISPERLKEL